jgi:hypothetical protein
MARSSVVHPPIRRQPFHPSSFRLHPFAMVARCLDQAGAAWSAMHALGVETDFDTFIQESVALFQSRVPTPAQLAARLRIEIHGALILNPGEVEALLAEEEEMANGRALQGEIAALERRRLIDTFNEMASPWVKSCIRSGPSCTRMCWPFWM